MSIPTCRDCGRIRLCIACNGTGRVACNHCDDGYIATDHWGYDDNPFQAIEPCRYCNGNGMQACDDCNGNGMQACDDCNNNRTEKL